MKCDVSKEDEVAAIVQTAVDEFGRLDVMVSSALVSYARHSAPPHTNALNKCCRPPPIRACVNMCVLQFNNAGIMHPADDNALNTEEKIWDLTQAINVKGVWYGCKHAIVAMRKVGCSTEALFLFFLLHAVG